MDYEVLESVEDVPVTDLAEYDTVDADNDIRQLDAALALDTLRLKLWYFEPGEAVDYHAHLRQEEVYVALEGDFELELGDPDDTTVREVEAGAWWAAKPEVGHGHRYLGDDRGVALAIGAPPVDDEAVDPTDLPA
ncbi:MAG: cupin domain-containing protein [Haloarculaceae archaeon]